MVRRVSKCGACGAPVTTRTERCAYCGNWLLGADPTASSTAGQTRSQWFSGEAGEFGFTRFTWPAIGLSVVLMLYVTGWFFEDFDYWLDDTAIALWAIACPVVLAIVAFGWRAAKPTVLPALAVCGLQWLVHVAMMAVSRGSISDDHVGIGAMFAGANLLGWLVGRGLHHGYRHRRIGSGAD